jgi:mannose-6-phosphate isomerase-like protein (cupin superfamily)
MTVREFLSSGELEAYALGCLNTEEQTHVHQMCRLYPEVRAELMAIELAMEQTAETLAIAPNPGIKERILSHLGFGLELSDLPVIDAQTDYEAWLKLLTGLIHEQPETIWFHPLTQKPELSQSLVYTRMGIPDETHEDLKESFFILEGRCRCMVGGREYVLGPGSFLEIPLHVHHDIELLTPYVVAILQQQSVMV